MSAYPLVAPTLTVFMTATPPAKSAALARPLQPSAALAAIVGAQPLPRTEVVKRMWDYIKARNLQNPANKRNVLCDGPLKAVMGKDEVTMFELTGLASKHLTAAQRDGDERTHRLAT